jgi:hypothetical protein
MTCLRECSEMSLERGLGLLTDVGLKDSGPIASEGITNASRVRHTDADRRSEAE